MGGAKLLKWRLAAEGAKLLKSRAVLILTCTKAVAPRDDADVGRTWLVPGSWQ